jgi:hypothetical protein
MRGPRVGALGAVAQRYTNKSAVSINAVTIAVWAVIKARNVQSMSHLPTHGRHRASL